MQPDFVMPDFLKNNSAEEIHQRMMASLPADIDDMPGGFAWDFTRPAALEKDEMINFHLARTLMLAFPQYAWDEWLDLHGQQVHLKRHRPEYASGRLLVSGKEGTVIPGGTVFCTAATESSPSIEFAATESRTIGEEGSAYVPISAVESGAGSNVAAGTITLMARPDKRVTSVRNPESIRGGTERENNDDYYDRIAAEYASRLTYVGNDDDYVRWAKEAGAGDCIVISAAEGPGTVKLALVDANGQPANEKLVSDVYQYIVSPEDRSGRLLPTACAQLICVPASTVKVHYKVTGILAEVEVERIREDFAKALQQVYLSAKQQGVLRYNDVRPVFSDIFGVTDFENFLMNGGTANILLKKEEYPETGVIDLG